MASTIEARANSILEQLKQNKQLRHYVDGTLPIPKPYHGSGKIKLIVLGQDPTVKNVLSRKKIKTVLNLDKKGRLLDYLTHVCNDLGLQLAKNVYATNLYKNFFIDPPAQIKITEIDIFQEFLSFWLPLLKNELRPFPDVPVITLGEPILAPLVEKNVSAKVRDRWGYMPGWKEGKEKSFQYIRAADNKLNRIVFPFPHQPSLRKEFYKARLRDYVAFVKATAFS